MSASCISVSTRPIASSSGVKTRARVWPSISASLHPRISRAPAFQAVTRPSRSVAMIAKSVALSMIQRFKAVFGKGRSNVR
ncbi:hypothetical protein ACVWYO_003229 [Sphingomonas sp. UYP23]